MNKPEIMIRAHALARSTRKQFPKADYRATFAAALRIAWAEAKAPAARAEWAAMSGDAQTDALRRMAYYCKRKDDAGTDRRAQPRAQVMRWIESEDDFASVIAEAWIDVARRLDADDADDTPLRVHLYRAVFTAARRINNAELRNARALRYHDADDGSAEGAELAAYIIDNAAPTAERIAPQPEEAALLRDMLAAVAADERDAAIIRLRAIGTTQTDIARALAMSQSAIAQRVEKMRARRDAYNAAS